MPNLSFFPEEVQEYIKDFEFNAPEIGLEFIEQSIFDETRHGVIHQYIFKYKDVFYRLLRDDSGSDFDEQCFSYEKENMFKIVKPKEVTVTIYE